MLWRCGKRCDRDMQDREDEDDEKRGRNGYCMDSQSSSNNVESDGRAISTEKRGNREERSALIESSDHEGETDSIIVKTRR
jgi:hypothetical protein